MDRNATRTATRHAGRPAVAPAASAAVAAPVAFVGWAAAAALAMLVIAVALPGADPAGGPSAPWSLLAEPLGATWLALMTLFAAAVVVLLRPSKLRAGLALAMGLVATVIAAHAMGLAIGSGRLDASDALAAVLSHGVGGRILVLTLAVLALAGPIWALGGASRWPRTIGAGVSLLSLLLLLVIGHLPYGDAIGTAPIAALLGALVDGDFIGDRIAALWVVLGVLVTMVSVALHAAFDDDLAARVSAWACWATLVALPLTCVALFTATAERWPAAMDGLKYGLTVSSALLLAASGLAGVAAPSRPADPHSASSSASLLSSV